MINIRGSLVRRRVLTVSAMLAATTAVAVSSTLASPSSPTSKPVRASATITVPGDTEGGSPGTTLFTAGHARLQGECGLVSDVGDGTAGGIAKLQVVAVGGPIVLTWTNPYTSQFVYLAPGATGTGAEGDPKGMEAIFVNGRPGGDLASPAYFAVLDANGPSFSGTAGIWLESDTGPCLFTAQVSG